MTAMTVRSVTPSRSSQARFAFLTGDSLVLTADDDDRVEPIGSSQIRIQVPLGNHGVLSPVGILILPALPS
jgi:hypothetical protein